MHAVIVATGYCEAAEPLVCYKPTPLFEIVDKPIIVHILEFLAGQGFTDIEIILSHLPHLIENALEEGTRWGLKITYHLAKECEHPYIPLKIIARNWEDPWILVGQGDCLPHIAEEWLKASAEQKPSLLVNSEGIWNGWGHFSAKTLANLPSDITEETLIEYLGANCSRHQVAPFYCTRSLKELLDSNSKFISFPEMVGIFPSSAHEVEPGIWISRGVSIHPGLTIIPPVFIGEDCQIMDHVKLGPEVVIERNCLIDKESKCHHSLICQRSYVGEGLEISNSIVDRNFLANVEHETSQHIRDDFILGELKRTRLLNWPIKMFERFLALILVVLTFPLYAFLRWQCNLNEKTVLKIPVSNQQWKWKTFKWTTFKAKKGDLNKYQRSVYWLPLFYSVLKGDAHFVGVLPLTVEEVNKLPEDRLNLYLRSKVGLITLADLEHGRKPNSDDIYAAETYYALHMGFFYDTYLFGRWMVRQLSKIPRFFTEGYRYDRS